jgi:hypothetical protein
VLLVREYVRLVWEVRAARVYEIYARESYTSQSMTLPLLPPPPPPPLAGVE